MSNVECHHDDRSEDDGNSIHADDGKDFHVSLLFSC
jgi:hypothetical protein